MSNWLRSWSNFNHQGELRMKDRSFNLPVGHRPKSWANTFFHSRVAYSQISNKSLQSAKKWAKVSRLKSKSKKVWRPKVSYLQQRITNTQHRPTNRHRLKKLHQGQCSSFTSAGTITTSSCVGWTCASEQNSPTARCNCTIRWTRPAEERKASGSNSTAVALSQLERLMRIMVGSDPSPKWPTQPCVPARRTQAITSNWRRTAPIASVIRAQPSVEIIFQPRPTSRKMKTNTCFKLDHQLLKRGLSSYITRKIRLWI